MNIANMVLTIMNDASLYFEALEVMNDVRAVDPGASEDDVLTEIEVWCQGFIENLHTKVAHGLDPRLKPDVLQALEVDIAVFGAALYHELKES